MLALHAGVKIAPVAYRASNQSLQDLVGGQIKLACDNFATAWEQVQGGKLRVISITSLTPYPLAKDVEITAKTLPGFEMMPAFGWVAPANMPAEITKKLIDELTAIGRLPECGRRWRSSASSKPNSPAKPLQMPSRKSARATPSSSKKPASRFLEELLVTNLSMCVPGIDARRAAMSGTSTSSDWRVDSAPGPRKIPDVHARYGARASGKTRESVEEFDVC